MLSCRTAALIAIIALSAVGCRKADPLVAEYSSIASGRPDGGWTVRLFASGICEVRGPVPGAGTYKTNNAGYQLETRVQSGWSSLFHSMTGTTTLVSVKTNGSEYLLDATAYRRFARTGDTNLLRYELRRMR